MIYLSTEGRDEFIPVFEYAAVSLLLGIVFVLMHKIAHFTKPLPLHSDTYTCKQFPAIVDKQTIALHAEICCWTCPSC